jgi:NADH dehydrogenase FAD-containing subunit
MFNYIYSVGAIIPVKIQQFINVFSNNDTNTKEKVYVIGNGWASYYFVKYLDKSKYNPIIIAPNTKVTNTPKLINRVIDEKAIVDFENPYGTIINDMLEDINVETKTLITKSKKKYHYNRVVIAIGSEPNDFNIPGVNEYAYKFKTIEDADILRERISNILIDNTIYIIGSGITGVELTSRLGPMYNINLIEGMSSILPGYNNKSKQVVENYFKQRIDQSSIKIKLNHLVKNIDSNKISLSIVNTNVMPDSNKPDSNKPDSNKPDSNKPNGNKFDYNNKDLIIWTGGVRFNGYGKTTLYETLNKITPIKPRGLDVNPDFTIGKETNIYCIGDMVANDGPPSAQNAKNQGICLAKYFNSDGKYLNKIASRGKLIHLNNKTYLESEYYSGFVPNIIVKLIEWFE